VSSGAKPTRRFDLDPTPEFFDDLETVDPFYLGQIHRAVEQLQHQPVEATRNRKQLKRPIAWCTQATHALRVGDYRVLYLVEESRVALLRLGLKDHERLRPVRIAGGDRL